MPHVLQTVATPGVATNDAEPLGVPMLRRVRKLVGGLHTCFAICEVFMLGKVLRMLGGGWMVGVARRSRNGESCSLANAVSATRVSGLDELGGDRDGTRNVGGLGHLGTAGGLLVGCWLCILIAARQVVGMVMDGISTALAAPMRPCPRIMPATAAVMACTLSGDGAAAVATTLCWGPGLAM